MTLDMKILSQPADLPFCSVCVESKMTRQPHHDTHISSNIPGHRIYADVGGSSSTYVTWKSYRYFILLVNNATHVTWFRFMKKKSDILNIFRDFVVMLEEHYNIKVYVLHTDFGEFNVDTSAEYFNHISIAWEPSAPNAQQ